MTSSLDLLNRHIRSAEDLASVVRTMKTLAAVNIRQFEEAVESLRDYRRNVESGLRMLLWDSSPADSHLEKPGHVGTDRELAVVFGSDQGMCGQFNQQMVTFVSEQFSEIKLRGTAADQSSSKPSPAVIVVGHRCAGLLEEVGFDVQKTLSSASSTAAVTECVQDLLSEIDRLRQINRCGRVALYFSMRTTATTTEPHRTGALPVDLRKFSGHREWERQSRSLPLHTVPRPELLSSLLREYLFVSLFRACAESLSSENAARIQSMQTAERNISERLTELRSKFNQSRQTSITEELLDIISGFEVLHRRANASSSS